MKITKLQQEEITNILNWSLKKVFKILDIDNENINRKKNKPIKKIIDNLKPLTEEELIHL